MEEESRARSDLDFILEGYEDNREERDREKRESEKEIIPENGELSLSE